MHDRQVGKIRHASNGFQNVESSKVPFRAPYGIQEADNVVDRVNDGLVEVVNGFVNGTQGRGRLDIRQLRFDCFSDRHVRGSVRRRWCIVARV